MAVAAAWLHHPSLQPITLPSSANPHHHHPLGSATIFPCGVALPWTSFNMPSVLFLAPARPAKNRASICDVICVGALPQEEVHLMQRDRVYRYLVLFFINETSGEIVWQPFASCFRGCCQLYSVFSGLVVLHPWHTLLVLASKAFGNVNLTENIPHCYVMSLWHEMLKECR